VQDVIAKFIELQKLEDEIIEAEKVLSEGPEKLAESQERLDKVTAAHDEVASGLKEARSKLKELELDMLSLKELLEGNHARSTRATGERSYRAVLDELEIIKKRMAENEDSTLEFMEKQDALKAALPGVEELLKAAQDAHSALALVVNADMESASASVEVRRASIDAMLATIDSAAAERFVASARAHGGRAMAAVTNGTCQACRLRIPPQLYNELQSHSKIMTCPSCARIMHFVAPAPKADEPPKEKKARKQKRSAEG
jgi:predicted  nucleic acid-binding Zn-ribbon protein